MSEQDSESQVLADLADFERRLAEVQPDYIEVGISSDQKYNGRYALCVLCVSAAVDKILPILTMTGDAHIDPVSGRTVVILCMAS